MLGAGAEAQRRWLQDKGLSGEKWLRVGLSCHSYHHLLAVWPLREVPSPGLCFLVRESRVITTAPSQVSEGIE